MDWKTYIVILVVVVATSYTEEIHDGVCPVTSEGSFGICSETCQQDGNCSANQKCCSNGCGHSCAEAIFPEIHDGLCPVTSEGSFGICSEMCLQDGNCSANQKCCSNGCGHSCAEAIFPVIHEGSCPTMPAATSSTGNGICEEDCSNDGACEEDEKCCSNGCGHQCTNETAGCPEVMCMMWCSHGFKQDADGCDVCECNQRTEIHSGDCPVVLSDHVGICITTCAHDGSCSSGQKCCSNGCGHTCVDALVVPDNSKPGTCPVVLEEMAGICSEDCSGDRECQGSTKCCSNGCGHACLQPDDIPVHNGTCPVGLLPEGSSGICSEMCSHDGECGPSQKCCSNGCGHACINTATNYTEGVCPAVLCRLFCPYGFERDTNGCEICSCELPPGVYPGMCPVGYLPEGSSGVCSEECSGDTDCMRTQKCCSNGCGHTCLYVIPSNTTVSCPDVMCMMWCEHGYQQDQNGCDTCYCHEPATCPDFICMMNCPHGNQLDGNGCAVCRCKDTPEIRPGTCPAGLTSSGMLGACANYCNNDFECSANQKCCSNGCGYVCVDVVDLPEIENPGNCPSNSDSAGGFGICLEDCTYDSDCSTSEKCCSNGCGHTCQTALNVTVHPGTCPVGFLPEGISGVCAEMCTNDGSCATNQKCCSNGCGHICVDVAPVCSDRVMCAMYCESGYVKDSEGCDTCYCIEPANLGSCPAVRDGVVGACVNLCEDDNGCEGGQICCSNGCGKTCIDPVPTSKPGTCPTFPMTEYSLGMCVYECENDHSCISDEKCCPFGCGMLCVAPDPDVGSNPGSATGLFATPFSALLITCLAILAWN